MWSSPPPPEKTFRRQNHFSVGKSEDIRTSSVLLVKKITFIYVIVQHKKVGGKKMKKIKSVLEYVFGIIV